LFVPKQVLLLITDIPTGSVDKLPTVTARTEAALVPQSFEAVTVIFPFWPDDPDVTVMLVVF
jgi:hypothetical protein